MSFSVSESPFAQGLFRILAKSCQRIANTSPALRRLSLRPRQQSLMPFTSHFYSPKGHRDALLIELYKTSSEPCSISPGKVLRAELEAGARQGLRRGRGAGSAAGAAASRRGGCAVLAPAPVPPRPGRGALPPSPAETRCPSQRASLRSLAQGTVSFLCRSVVFTH